MSSARSAESGVNEQPPLRNPGSRTRTASDRPKPVTAFAQLGVEFDGRTDGDNWSAVCPFCDKPKFSVHRTGKFRCWSAACDERGNLEGFWRTAYAEFRDGTTADEYRALLKKRKLPESWSRQLARLGLARGVGTWLVPAGDAKKDVSTLTTWKGKGDPFALASFKAGLFGARELRSAPSGCPVWILEGIGDWLAASILHKRALADGVVVGVPGAGAFANDWLPLLQRHDVFLCYDHDEDGRAGARKAAAKLATVASAVHSVVWPANTPDKFDATDFITQEYRQGKARKTWRKFRALFRTVEVEAIETAPSPFFDAFKHTERGVASRVASEHGADLRFVPQWNAWLRWDGKRWSRSAQVVTPLIDETLATMTEEAIQRARDGDASAIKQTRALLRSRAIKGVEGCMQNFPVLRAETDRWDRDAWFLNCQNCTVDVRTGAAHAHRRADSITRLARADYEPDAKAPRFLRFLREIQPDPKVRAYVQRALGYALTGLTTEHVLHVAWGQTRTGKSTLFETVLHVLGDYAWAAPSTLLLQNRNDRLPTEVAGLFGKRFVITSETSEGARLNEALVKLLTGGDTITTRRLYENLWSFDPTHKLFLFTNHKPSISGDAAMWARLRLIPFTANIAPSKRDPRLKQKLRQEAPGILRWLVDGAVRFHQEGLDPPSAVLAATEDYRVDEDVLGAFIADRLTEDPTATMPTAAVHKLYQAWATRQGIRVPWTQKMLTTRMKERGFRYQRTPDRAFVGVKQRRKAR